MVQAPPGSESLVDASTLESRPRNLLASTLSTLHQAVYIDLLLLFSPFNNSSQYDCDYTKMAEPNLEDTKLIFGIDFGTT